MTPPKPQPSVVDRLTRLLVPGIVVAYLLAIAAGLLLLVYGALAGSWHGVVGGAVLCLFGSRGVWKILMAGQGAGANQAALARFFDETGALLYVGITNCLPRRLDQHHRRKDWSHRVASVRVEHFPSREAAHSAERAAVSSEHPKYNIRLRRRPTRVKSEPPKSVDRRVDDKGGRWLFRSLECDFTRICDLWLYPELDGSPMVDYLDTDDGDEQLEEYVAYVQKRNPDWWESDRVPILWVVEGGGLKMEFAPYGQVAWLPKRLWPEDFLTFYTWPEDRHTGEPLDWFRLPVKNERFPEFAKALGWRPSPLQPFAPLRSIVENRNQYYRFLTPCPYRRWRISPPPPAPPTPSAPGTPGTSRRSP